MALSPQDAINQVLGIPYAWGQDTPQTGFDCSGLVVWWANKCGGNMPRWSSEDMWANLPAGSAAPWNLVLFDTGGSATDTQAPPQHVGICANEGCTMMYDAPDTGQVVQLESIAGFGTVMGYRSVPGVTDGSAAASSNATPAGPGMPSATDFLEDPVGAVEQAVETLLVQWITDAIEVLTGGKSPAELVIRFLEISAGVLLLGGGALGLLVVVAKGAKPPAQVAHTRRAVRNVKRADRGLQRSAKHLPDRALRSKKIPRRYTEDEYLRRRAREAPRAAEGHRANRGQVIDVKSQVVKRKPGRHRPVHGPTAGDLEDF